MERRDLPGRAGGHVPSIVQSLNYAFEGVIHVLRTQRNMRLHFAAGTGVLVAAVLLGVSRADMLALVVAIAFVLICEMFNTALEATVDLAQPELDPLARVAKDVSAGAVLVSSVTALTIGYLAFADRLSNPSSR